MKGWDGPGCPAWARRRREDNRPGQAEATAGGKRQRELLLETTTAADIVTHRPLPIRPMARLSQSDIVRAFALGGVTADR